jgi:hypothetical protein
LFFLKYRRHLVKKLILAITVLGMGVPGFGRTPEATGVPSPFAAVSSSQAKPVAAQPVADSPDSSTCSFTFTTNSERGSINYCVSANGNLVVLEIPKDVPMVSQANHAEGYGICDTTTNVSYTDYGGLGDSKNWGNTIVVSHDSKSVKLARTTTDSVWTLTQTITKTGGALPTAKIVMALTNNTGTLRRAVLLRYADIDAAGQAPNNLDSTANSAFAWNPVFPGDPSFSHGLTLQNLGSTNFSTFGLAQATPAAPDPCGPFVTVAPALLQAVDGSLVMFYEPTVRSHATVTVTAAYRGR